MMTTLASLWLPICVATGGVFFASSLIHMVFKWHNSDYLKLPNEDAVRATVGKPAPGQYVIPHCIGMEEMKKPEVQQKFADGPVAFLLVRPNGLPNMGASLGQWLGLNALISVTIAYMGAHTLPMTDSFWAIARLTGGAAFLAHAAGPVSSAIWMGRSWNSVVKDVLDAAIYATVTAASFGALWPAAH